MKKTICVILAAALCALLSACGSLEKEENTSETLVDDPIIEEYYGGRERNEDGRFTTASADKPYESSESAKLVSVSNIMKPGEIGSVVIDGYADVQYNVSVYNDYGKAFVFTESGRISADENGRAVCPLSVPEDTPAGNYVILLKQDGGSSYVLTVITVTQ